jgi:hypothetical protein
MKSFFLSNAAFCYVIYEIDFWLYKHTHIEREYFYLWFCDKLVSIYSGVYGETFIRDIVDNRLDIY